MRSSPTVRRLAAARADGAHTYFVPPEHTARARETLGAGKLLAPEQVCVLSTDASIAREIARRHTTSYLRLANYTNNLRRFGFDDDDFGHAVGRLLEIVSSCAASSPLHVTRGFPSRSPRTSR